MNQKSVISLRTQSVNLGDYLILVASIDYLLTRYEMIVLDTQGAPTEFVQAVKQKYRVEIERGRIVSRALGLSFYLVNKFDFFRKAGALSASTTLKSNINYLAKACFNLYRRAFNLGNAYFFPVSIAGKLNLFSKLFFRSFKHIFVRDRASADRLLVTSVTNVTQVPDMSHYVNSSLQSSVKTVTGSKAKPEGALSAAISFRFDRFPSIARLRELVNAQPIDVDYAVTQVLYDTRVNEELAAAFGARHYVASINAAGIESVSDIYGQCDIVISNRLHVLLLAMFVGTTPIPLVQKADYKVTDYFSSLGYMSLNADEPFNEGDFMHVYQTNCKVLDLKNISHALEASLNEFIV